ncbi:hypothetical protein SSP24_29430 [Streptomyces spinoverrucosus]|uniref:Uncharacterized protein n=1 Tax=Streptomyces spinoverrucosus TaxID=284043 RepID=A0A4Y3VGQ6_9ACTN|nr:hypothetical protein SSP24_29430 [Streptomyces spinoverrucosus]
MEARARMSLSWMGRSAPRCPVTMRKVRMLPLKESVFHPRPRMYAVKSATRLAAAGVRVGGLVVSRRVQLRGGAGKSSSWAGSKRCSDGRCADLARARARRRLRAKRPWSAAVPGSRRPTASPAAWGRANHSWSPFFIAIWAVSTSVSATTIRHMRHIPPLSIKVRWQRSHSASLPPRLRIS